MPMSENLSQATTELAVEKQSDVQRLARERLLWAVKPFGFLGIMLWILSPETADQIDIQQETLLAFLLGSLYGVAVYYNDFKAYLIHRGQMGRDQHNRVPEEYYWGHVETVLARWK